MKSNLTYRLIEDHTLDGERSGEGSAVALNDGRLLLMYSAFRGDGWADHSPGRIFQRTSFDSGLSWSPPQVAFPLPPGALNAMGVSLLRLQDGRIGCVYLVKWTQWDHCIPYWTTSSDEAASWLEPAPIFPGTGYFVVNNDRLIQLRDGTIVLPYALHEGMQAELGAGGSDTTPFKQSLNAKCGIFYSKDGGCSWKRPNTARRFSSDWFVPPSPFRPESVEEVSRRIVETRYDVFQEPGVVELKDGRLMMWVRSNAHVYWSLLEGLDSHWADYRIIEGFNICKSPQTIKRLPGSDRLVMLYNDRHSVGYGELEFMYRTPLSVACSDDEGSTWKRLGPLEADESKSYCYFSLLFFQDAFLATYYESVPMLAEDGAVSLNSKGLPFRRNLASLKACMGLQSFFYD